MCSRMAPDVCSEMELQYNDIESLAGVKFPATLKFVSLHTNKLKDLTNVTLPESLE